MSCSISGQVKYLLIPHGIHIIFTCFFSSFVHFQHKIPGGRTESHWRLWSSATDLATGPNLGTLLGGKRRPIGDEWVVSSLVWILGISFFSRVLGFIEEDLEIETRTNNKPSEMVSEQLLQKNSWNTETSFALFFLWADVFPITGTGWELSSWPQDVPRLYEADPTWQ